MKDSSLRKIRVIVASALLLSSSIPLRSIPPEPHRYIVMAPQDLPGGGGGGGISSKTCGSKLRVLNRTTGELKFIYSRDGLSTVYTVKELSYIDISPVYCSSSLTVVTAKEKRSELKVDSNQTYEIDWSKTEEKYVVRPVPSGAS